MKRKFLSFLMFLTGITCLIVFVKSPSTNTGHRPVLVMEPNQSDETNFISAIPIKPCSATLPKDTMPKDALPQSWDEVPDAPRTPDHVKFAERNGALAKVTFHVTNAKGQSVEGANIEAAFYNHGRDGYVVMARTDSNGLATVEQLCVSELNYYVRKEGYYQTTDRYWFYRRWKDCVQDGKWVPWNPTLEVTLKEIRNPVPMNTKGFNGKIPISGEYVGYDLGKGDWIKPYGDGKIADVEFLHTEDKINPAEYTYNLHLALRFLGEHNGATLKKKDKFSGFSTEYTVSDNIFQKQYDYRTEVGKGVLSQCTRLEDNEYLVFRVRSKTNDMGEIVSAYYGQIYGFGYTHMTEGKIRFRYYFNPNENDKNIEFK